MATTRPAFSTREQLVTIFVDSNGNLLSVAPETFEISKGAHEEVLWQTSPPNADFTVDFGDSPFNYPDFTQDNPYSCEVRREVPGDGKYYKYTVTAGAKSIDPGGHVNP